MYRSIMGAIMALAVLAGAQAHAANYPNARLIVGAEDLSNRAADAQAATELRIIDVRPREAYEAGHIPGAINLPFTLLTDQNGHVAGVLRSQPELAALLGAADLDARSEIVLYDDRGGFRAARLFWLLEWFGHNNVAILNGGVSAWTEAGYALNTEGGNSVERMAAAGLDTAAEPFPIAHMPRRHASADWILERRGDEETVVIDVRPTKLYDAGHIPWAQNVPWAANLQADDSMLDAGALAAHFAGLGIDPEDNIVIHCQTGEASAHSYFALRLLGYPRVRVYHRSWAEWGTSDDLPKVLAE